VINQLAMDELRRLIAQVDDDSDSHIHKQIFSKYTLHYNPALLTSPRTVPAHIQKTLLDSPNTPPLDVHIYAVRNILYPTLILSQIPDIIDLLAFIESFRLRATENARKVQKSYRASLTPKQELEISRMTNPSKNNNYREIYVILVLELCTLV
jgi:hypothetical protein